eukprot:gene11466-11559_t
MKIAENLTFSPIDYANQGNSIIGIRGSGKTYTAMKLAEQLMLSNIPIIAFDPTGIWQNLRYGDHGKKGFPIVVAGGLHPDIELSSENCTQIIEAALSENISLVIDLQGRATATKTKWLYIVSSCIDYLMQHNLDHGLRHIFIEEAAEFVPQRPNPGGAMAYSKLEAMARMGRNYGLGYTLINQRPEEIAKAIFEISEMVIVHRQSGKNSLKSMRDWLNYKDVSDTKIVESIPKLQNGECWAIDNKGEILIKVLPKDTFHPDPKKGNNTAPLKSATDISGFIERFRDLVAFEEERPKTSAHKTDHRLNDLEKEVESLKFTIGILQADNGILKKQNRELSKKLSAVIEIVNNPLPDEISQHSTVTIDFPSDEKPKIYIQEKKPSVSPGKTTGGMLRILKAAAMFYPKIVSKQRIGTLTGLSINSGTFGTYLATLKRDGLISASSHGIVATESGLDQAGKVEPLPSDPAVLIEMWCNHIGNGSVLKENAEAAYAAADEKGKNLLKGLFPDVFETDPYAKACRILGIKPIPAIADDADADIRSIDAYSRLIICIRAKNMIDGKVWKPLYDGSETHYWPYFNLESGFGFSYTRYVTWRTITFVGSRLEYRTEELAQEGYDTSTVLPDVSALPEWLQKYTTGTIKRVIIAEAINEGRIRKPGKEWVYFPVWNLTEGSSGFGFSHTFYGLWSTDTTVGSRLEFFTRDNAKYFGENFMELHRDVLLVDEAQDKG